MIGKKVTVKIDRPMGSYHPKHKDIAGQKFYHSTYSKLEHHQMDNLHMLLAYSYNSL